MAHTRHIRLPLSGPRPRGPFAWLKTMAGLQRTRRHLLDLDDALLRDIGLTRDEAMDEAARRPWDAPATWRR